MRRRVVFVGAIVVCVVSASGARPQAPTGVPQAKSVVVDAQREGDYLPLEGARVFVIGTDGRDLAVAVTNKVGRAVLRYVDASERPRYVLVEMQGYFVTGLPWRPGLLEYWILVGGIAVK